MAKRQEITIKEGVEDLKKLRRKCISSKEEKRLEMLILLKSDTMISRKKLSLTLDISDRTLRRWILSYNEFGLSFIFSSRNRNRNSKIITQEMSIGLEKRVSNPKTGFLSYVDAKNWIKEVYNVNVNYHTLRDYLKSKFKTKLKSPRRSHVKKAPESVETFFKTAK